MIRASLGRSRLLQFKTETPPAATHLPLRRNGVWRRVQLASPGVKGAKANQRLNYTETCINGTVSSGSSLRMTRWEEAYHVQIVRCGKAAGPFGVAA